MLYLSIEFHLFCAASLCLNFRKIVDLSTLIFWQSGFYSSPLVSTRKSDIVGCGNIQKNLILSCSSNEPMR